MDLVSKRRAAVAHTNILWPKTMALSAIALLASTSVAANAAGTVAGTDILNVAEASYDDNGGGRVVVPSNEVTIKVDELLDVTVASSDAGDIPVDPGDTQQVTTYLVTNTGNGTEEFVLSADTTKAGDDFDTANPVIYIDANGDGVFDINIDTLYTPGSNEPELAPDASVTVFILSDIPGSATDGQRAEVELTATAETGSGVPGTVFAGAGDGNTDAVVGASGAEAEDSSFFVIESALVSLVKSATIADPFGGTQPVPGATITYQLVANVSGSGTLNGLVITDDIPADTSYVAESITLNGVARTDTDADADDASFDGSEVTVNLGSVAGGNSRTITFQVTID